MPLGLGRQLGDKIGLFASLSLRQTHGLPIDQRQICHAEVGVNFLVFGGNFLAVQQLVAHDAFGNFTQSDHGWLVVFFFHQCLGVVITKCARTSAGQHDEIKTVIHMLQAIFNGNTGHEFLV